MKSMILAVDINGGNGYKGKLPWPHIADDMTWFRYVTMQYKRCIMGRKTWESVGKLEGRECHVVTSCGVLEVDGADAVHPTPPPLEDGDIVIGGASMYEHYADQVDVVFLTEVSGAHLSDVKIDLEHLLKYHLLHAYVFIEGGHVLNVYAKKWTTVEDIVRTSECVSGAIDMLMDYKDAIGAQYGAPVPDRKDLESVVDSPAHYTQGGIETIDAIGAITAGYEGEDAFCAGNVAKYIARAPFKGNRAEDLQKALWYLERLITNGDNDDY